MSSASVGVIGIVRNLSAMYRQQLCMTLGRHVGELLS